jgi:glycosyltransferase involved in cell wall biosynthesis
MLAAIMTSAKRRILFLITTSDWGGAQSFVCRMAAEAKRAGHDVMVAAGGNGELGKRCADAGVHFEQLETLRRELSPLHDLAAIHEIRKIIRGYKPDVVHLNSSKMGVVGSIAASIEHVSRIIYRIGGWAFLEDVPSWKRATYLWSEKLTASHKDVIVTVHPGDEEEAKRHNIRPKDRVITIPNGLDLSSFDKKLLDRDSARKELGLGPTETVIGTVANFYPPKDLPRYLASMAPLLTSTNLRLVIIGDGPERNAVEQAIQENDLTNHVMLAGRRSDSATLLRAFDLFVLPSSKEGMPWSLLEAMAAGLPCVATDVGACRWMLEPDTGIIVPPKNGEAMRNAIQSLLTDEQKRAALGAAARHAVETRFRWEDAVRQTLALL